MKNYFRLIRIKHWIKNALIFLPLFFSINILNVKLLSRTILGFLVFSIVSSIIYIINDIFDIKKDKKHPIKCKRPLASGAITKKIAVCIAIVFFIISILLISVLYMITDDLLVILIPLLYLVINISYSYKLKSIPILDVVIIVSGFLLRVMYGGIISNIEISKYLYLMIFFGGFFLGFGKRRNEIIKNGTKSRKVLTYYNEDFLNKNMYVDFSLAVVSYTLWCVDPFIIDKIGHNYMFWTVPLFMIIMQLYSLDIEKDSYGDPIDVIVRDKILIVLILIYIFTMGVMLYIL